MRDSPRLVTADDGRTGHAGGTRPPRFLIRAPSQSGRENSLDYNYLAVAERAGAVALTRAEVLRIEPSDDGYHVTYQDHAEGGVHRTLTGRSVFLAAGAVATTELLLRARDLDNTLPDLSPRLGEGFSGNGDFLSLIRRTRIPLDPERAPTITTTSVVDFDEAGSQVWFQVQDGAYPAVLSRLGATLNPIRRFRERMVRARRSTPSHLATHAKQGRRVPNRSIMALLLMGRDASQSRLVLDHHNQASVQWNNRANRRLCRAEGQVGRAPSLECWAVAHRMHPPGACCVGPSRCTAWAASRWASTASME